METNISDLTLTYFPYTFLENNDLKRLLLYFDTIRLLQVFSDFDPGLPDLLHTSQSVQLFCPISTPSMSEAIRRALQFCHQLGSVHQDGGLVELFRTFALQENYEDSRTALVAQLRQAHPRLAPEEVELVNDALFLLLAHQLDQDQSEMDLELERIRRLENKFHAEMGIGSDEEKDFEPLRSHPLTESDRSRTQYPFQRLRAWTHLFFTQEKTDLFLPLTTSAEVLGEITERSPSESILLTSRLPASESEPRRLTILPDPQQLSLEEVLELRQSLSGLSILKNWRASFSAVISRLQQETLPPEEWLELRQHLQKATDGFQQHWPKSVKPCPYLQLECICYPKVTPKLAFSLATGLKPASENSQAPENLNGIILLLRPVALPMDQTS